MGKKQALATQTRKRKGRFFELDIESKTDNKDGMLKVNWSTSLLARAAKGDKRRNEQRNEKHRSEHTGEAEKDNLTSEGNSELTKKTEKTQRRRDKTKTVRKSAERDNKRENLFAEPAEFQSIDVGTETLPTEKTANPNTMARIQQR